MGGDDLRLRYTADASGVESELGKIGGAHRAAEGASSRWGSAMSKVGGAASAAMRGTATAVTTVGAAFLGTSLVKGSQRFMDIEDATASLTITLGDAAKAGEFMGEVLDIVRGTPFNLDQFALAGKNLIGFGVEASKVPGILTAIGEAAAASGNGAEAVDRIVASLGKASAQTKITGETINELSAQGVPALQILANHFGVATDDMRKMLRKGAIPAAEGIDALTKGIMDGSTGVAGATVALGGSMDSLRKTTRGALGGLGAATARFGEGIISAFASAGGEGNVLAGIFTSLTDVVDMLGEKAAAMAQRFANSPGFQAFLDFMLDLPKKVKNAAGSLDGLKTIIGPLTGLFVAVGSKGVSGMLGPLGRLIPVISPLMGIFIGLMVTSPGLRDALMDIVKALLPLAEAISTALLPVIAALLPVIETVGVALAGGLAVAIGLVAAGLIALIDALGPLAGPLLAVGLVVLKFGGILKMLVPILGLVGKAAMLLFANPIGLAVLAVILVATLVWKHWDKIAGFLKKVWNKIKEVAVTVFDFLRDFFKKWGVVVLAALMGPVGLLVLFIIKNWDAIKRVTLAVFTAVRDFFVAVWARIRDVFLTVTGFLRNHISAVFNVYKTIIVTVFNAVRDFIARVWGAIAGTVGYFIGIIRDGVVGGFTKARDFVVEAVNRVSERVGQVFRAIKDAAQTGIDFVVAKFRWLRDEFNRIVGRIVEIASKLMFWRSSPSVMEIHAALSTAGVVDSFQGLKSTLSREFDRFPSLGISTALPNLTGRTIGGDGAALGQPRAGAPGSPDTRALVREIVGLRADLAARDRERAIIVMDGREIDVVIKRRRGYAKRAST